MNMGGSPDLRSLTCSFCVILLSSTEVFGEADKLIAKHNLLSLSRVLIQSSLNGGELHNIIVLGTQ